MLGDFDACRVAVGIEVGRHSQAGSGGCRADELQRLLVTVERFGGPIPADLAG